MEVINTNIHGLSIRMNKVVKDNRGFLAEIAPFGLEYDFLKAGLKGIHISVATEKNVARAGHSHKKNIENFFTISGTALWLFVDCRQDSPTFNKFYSVILGQENPTLETDTPSYIIKDSQMAQVLVPAGIYHIFWPLTDEDVTIIALASEPYNKDDYDKINLGDYPEIKEYLIKFGISV